MCIKIFIEGSMEFDKVLRNEKKGTTIPIVYFMVHSYGRPFVDRNKRLVFLY